MKFFNHWYMYHLALFTSVYFDCSDDWFYSVGVSELPLFDFSLWDLCRFLEVKDLILLFTSVLLEHQILLYSSGKNKCTGSRNRFMIWPSIAFINPLFVLI